MNLMEKLKNTPMILWVILFVNIINAREFYFSWLHTPSERLSWLTFAIWLLPVVISFFKERQQNTNHFPNFLLAIISIVLVLFSIITSLNTAAYLGLAFSFAAIIPWSLSNIFWLVGSISWMPAFGWFLTTSMPGTSNQTIQVMRIIISSLCTISWIVLNYRKVNE
jgi:hypothetical protein